MPLPYWLMRIPNLLCADGKKRFSKSLIEPSSFAAFRRALNHFFRTHDLNLD
jgi:hypothetical protein